MLGGEALVPHEWLVETKVDLVVMESTGIYWKSLYSHIERTGIEAWSVNAHFR